MELKYIVYLTINLCNGKFYIGVHKTNPNVFDGYIGCGIYRQSNASQRQAFHSAVRKYGYNNFKRTILRIFPDTEEGKQAAYNLEKELVTETVLRSKTCYNESVGGNGGVAPKYMKGVNQFDLSGKFIRSYKSIGEAALSLGIQNVESAKQAIKNCLRETSKTKTAYNYIWSREQTVNKFKNDRLQTVAQYTLSGKFIRHFDSISEASDALQTTSIGQAITKKYQAVGYQWRYFNGDCSDIEPLINNGTKFKNSPIIMYKLNGEIVGEFKNSSECKKKFPQLTTNLINKVLTGKQSHHKGFVFKYKDEDIV